MQSYLQSSLVLIFSAMHTNHFQFQEADEVDDMFVKARSLYCSGQKVCFKVVQTKSTGLDFASIQSVTSTNTFNFTANFTKKDNTVAKVCFPKDVAKVDMLLSNSILHITF